MKKYLANKPYKPAFTRLLRDTAGVSSVELAIMLPLLVLFTFGILEFALAMGAYLQINEATRAAARTAVIQPAVADLSSLDSTPATCTSSGSSVSCGSYSVASSAAYSAILAEVQRVRPDITAEQLEVSYSASGTGYSSTADGTAPLVTIRIIGYEHSLILQNLVGISTIAFPDFATSRIKNY